jgi:hypothetical protein
MRLRSIFLRPRIVASNHFTTADAKRDHPVRVLGH